MKLKIVRGRAIVGAKDETCGQTPAQEQQLRGLGWTEHDIDNMSARQIEIILKKKTRRRVKGELGRPDNLPLTAENSPDQILALLQKRGKSADEIYGWLKEHDYTLYVIGDFFKKDLPKLRALSEALLKKKKDLEVAVYKYRVQLMKDLKEAHKNVGQKI